MVNSIRWKSCSAVFAAALALAAQAAEVQGIGGFLEQGKVGAGGEGVVASDRIEWRTRSERVDVAEADTKALFHFGFINRLDESVKIAKVIAPCGCTTVDFRPEPVPPGGVGGISAVLDFGMAVGRLTKHVSVEISNASGSFRQSYDLGD